MSLGQACGEGERFADVLLFEVREIGEELGNRATCCESFDDHSHGDTHAADAGLAAHNFRIERDAAELLHTLIIAFTRGVRARRGCVGPSFLALQFFLGGVRL